jgi:hypothetical protein
LLILDTASAANPEEEVGWDEDSDDEAAVASTQPASTLPKVLVAQNANDSSTTLHQTPPTAQPPNDPSALQPSRRSHDEKSVADSDASYDLVSGATSRAPGSPKDENMAGKKDESDEEDWE